MNPYTIYTKSFSATQKKRHCKACLSLAPLITIQELPKVSYLSPPYQSLSLTFEPSAIDFGAKSKRPNYDGKVAEIVKIGFVKAKTDTIIRSAKIDEERFEKILATLQRIDSAHENSERILAWLKTMPDPPDEMGAWESISRKRRCRNMNTLEESSKATNPRAVKTVNGS